MNIYQIQKDLLAIFDELEENGGELTPELEEQLNITQESFKDKVKSYVNVIKHFEDDLRAIKLENDRLKKLKERKEKIIKQLDNIIIEAIEKFGDTKKSGTKYFDYGTGEVSIRTTQAVELNDYNIDHIIDCLHYMLDIEAEHNQLDVIEGLSKESFLNLCATKPTNDSQTGINISDNDIDHVAVKLSTNISLKDIFEGSAWMALKEVIKYNPRFKLESGISKSNLKIDLKENGACAPHIGKLTTNKNLNIK